MTEDLEVALSMAVPTTDTQTNRDVRKAIWSLAWPVVSRMFLQGIVGMVDIMMVGRLGASAIAAVSLSNRLVFIMIGALQALAVGATALVAQYVGAKRPADANRVMWQALLGSLLLAVVLCTLGFLAAPWAISRMLALQESMDVWVVQQGTIYLRIVLLSMILGLPQITINALLQGAGDMKTPLYLMGISNVINVVGNYVLIFGIGPFPALGVTGAAIATGGSRAIAAVLGLLVLLRGTQAVKLKVYPESLRLDVEVIGRILRVGIPASVEQLIRQGSMIIYAFLVASLGTLSLAANEIVMNAQSISFMPGFGFGMAATTLVGQSIGANRPKLAERYGIETAKLAATLMGAAGLCIFLWPQVLVRLYTNDPALIAAAATPLRIVALIQPLFAVVMVLSGALRGAGDTKWVMYATLLGNLGVRLILSYLAAFYLNLGLVGFWLAVAVDMLARGGLIVYRYRSGNWKVGVIGGVGRAATKSTTS